MKIELGGFVEGLKYLPRYAVPVAVVAGLLLFGPSNFLEGIGLEGFVEQYRPWLGVAFLLAIALALTGLWPTVARAVQSRAALREYRRSLMDLTPPERRVLAAYVVSNTTSLNFSLADGVVRGLEGKRVLYRSSSLGHALDGFAFNLQPWAKKYLWKHEGLLEPELGALREETASSRRRSL